MLSGTWRPFYIGLNVLKSVLINKDIQIKFLLGHQTIRRHVKEYFLINKDLSIDFT